MRLHARGLALSLLALCSLSFGACSLADESNDTQDIIGGVDARSAKLDAIGTVGTRGWDGKYGFFCTATLIAPKVVLTAKHCATSGPGETPRLAGEKIYFATGWNVDEPKQVIEAVDVLLSPVDEGGMVQFGSDVAVYILAEPVLDVTPMPYATAHLGAEMIGTKLQAVGYGVQDRDRTTGTRKAGTLTLRAVEGQPMHALFETKEALYQAMADVEGQAWVDSNKARLDTFYDFTLLAGYEAYLGMGTNDAQPCSGDSGGPLVANVGGKLQVVSVVSGSFKGAKYPCSVVGEAYATLGAKVQEIIQSATGPCEGVPVAGRCEQFSTVVRCVSDAEGPQKITRTDCGLLNQACEVVDGTAACVDPL